MKLSVVAILFLFFFKDKENSGRDGGFGYFHYLRSIMKKIVRYLFLFALAFTLAGVVGVSCQKGGEEEDVPEVGSDSQKPYLQPVVIPFGSEYTIQVEGTKFSLVSSGYSYKVYAESITFEFFTCYLTRGKKFELGEVCNLTLIGDSQVIMSNEGIMFGGSVRLSGTGRITMEAMELNTTFYNDMFSAAEGYTVTMGEKKKVGNNLYSCTWTVDKSK